MININQLARQYDYDETTIMQIWIPKGLDMTISEKVIRVWVIQNILKPLRDTDLNEQIQRERLRRMVAEASQAELELAKELEQVVDVVMMQINLGIT